MHVYCQDHHIPLMHVKEAWRYRTDATTVRKMLYLLSNRGKDEMCKCQLTVWCISTGCMVDIGQKCFEICMKGSGVCFMWMFTPLHTIIHRLCGCLYANAHIQAKLKQKQRDEVSYCVACCARVCQTLKLSFLFFNVYLITLEPLLVTLLITG